MEEGSLIKCPECNAEINVSSILYHQVKDKTSKEFNAKLKELELQKEQLKKDQIAIEETINNTVKSKLNNEKLKLEQELYNKLQQESFDQISALKEELDNKSNQLIEFNKVKIEIEKIKREKNELEVSISLAKEKEFNDKLHTERIKIENQIENNYNLKNKELEKQLEDQKKLIDEMNRKANQGSTQLQGEIQELALEEILKNIFPFDIISEVGKGIKGADIIHTVNNKIGTKCGTILYESKRTKSFSNEWISKLKSDAILAKADMCVIVTEAMPDDIEKIGHKDGVWICSFNDFKSLILVLRESIINVYEAYSSQTNKGEKMEMLYNYLTSNEFVLQIGAVVEGFNELQQGYIKEKNAMEKIWKTREKQLEKVLLNTNHFIGSMKGIAGSSIINLKQITANDNALESVD